MNPSSSLHTKLLDARCMELEMERLWRTKTSMDQWNQLTEIKILIIKSMHNHLFNKMERLWRTKTGLGERSLLPQIKLLIIKCMHNHSFNKMERLWGTKTSLGERNQLMEIKILIIKCMHIHLFNKMERLWRTNNHESYRYFDRTKIRTIPSNVCHRAWLTLSNTVKNMQLPTKSR